VLNPYVCPIEGDLSRADVVVLTMLCRGRRVIEFGIGGSTIILSQICTDVISYEHEPIWIERFRPMLNDIVTVREINKNDELKSKGEHADVLFIDGHSNLRWKALIEFWPYVNVVLLHDTRMPYAANCLIKFFERESHYKYLAHIEWNYLESNMAVLWKRPFPLEHEDWKVTEAGNNRRGYGRA